MPRNRSRSRSRERHRSRSPRDRTARRVNTHDSHKRNRSRSPHYRSRSPEAPTSSRRSSRSPRRRSPSPRRRSRSRDRYDDRRTISVSPTPETERPKIDESQLEGMSEADAEMMRTMGFTGFNTTKGKKVSCNNIYVAKLTQKRRYRQYMNRRGGFNRPLDFIA